MYIFYEAATVTIDAKLQEKNGGKDLTTFLANVTMCCHFFGDLFEVNFC